METEQGRASVCEHLGFVVATTETDLAVLHRRNVLMNGNETYIYNESANETTDGRIEVTYILFGRRSEHNTCN
jgi:hypothetical protein